MFNRYLNSINETNNVIKKLNGDEEIKKIAESDRRWASNKYTKFRNERPKKGEIYQIEFGKNFTPEMSYEHRGLVIGIQDKLLYVLPIFTYKKDKYSDVYHPIDFPESRSNFFLLKNEEFDFINHDSIVKVNDLRSVSVNRILYKHKGRIAPTSDIYSEIENLTIQKHFGNFMFNYKKTNKELKKAMKEIDDLKKEIDNLKKEIEILNERQ